MPECTNYTLVMAGGAAKRASRVNWGSLCAQHDQPAPPSVTLAQQKGEALLLEQPKTPTTV